MNLPNQSAPVQRQGTASVSASSNNFGTSDYSECVGASVNSGGQVCFTLPVVGSICVPVSTPIPQGASVQACGNICTVFGIPTGISVSVTALGIQVYSNSWGYC